MRNQIINALKVSALAVVLSFGMSYAFAWTAPLAAPTTGNVAAPINTGSSVASQIITGKLTVTATTTTGTLVAGGLGVIANSFTTNAITFGDGTTQATAGVSNITAGSGISISPAGGTGAVTITNTYPTSCSASFTPTHPDVPCGTNGTGVTFTCSGGRLISVTAYTFAGSCASG